METYNFPPFPAKGERRLFMPSNYTSNYNLNQWEPDDRVLRTDFNADNAKIDAALAKKAEAKVSLYSSLHSDPTNGISIAFSGKAAINWDDWEYVVLWAELEMPLRDGEDTLRAVTLPNLKGLLTIKPSPFFMVFLPRHDGTRKLSGFVVGEGATYFSSDISYNELTQLDFLQSGDMSHKLQNIHVIISGEK